MQFIATEHPPHSWIMYKPTFISFNFRDAIVVLSSGSETNSPEMESDDQVSASWAAAAPPIDQPISSPTLIYHLSAMCSEYNLYLLSETLLQDQSGEQECKEKGKKGKGRRIRKGGGKMRHGMAKCDISICCTPPSGEEENAERLQRVQDRWEWQLDISVPSIDLLQERSCPSEPKCPSELWHVACWSRVRMIIIITKRFILVSKFVLALIYFLEGWWQMPKCYRGLTGHCRQSFSTSPLWSTPPKHTIRKNFWIYM